LPWAELGRVGAVVTVAAIELEAVWRIAGMGGRTKIVAADQVVGRSVVVAAPDTMAGWLVVIDIAVSSAAPEAAIASAEKVIQPGVVRGAPNRISTCDCSAAATLTTTRFRIGVPVCRPL